jgi:glycosyltransferase involved in cell wall biosynthesis
VGVPFLLLGDHPALPSGLGRILRDLVQQLAQDPSLDLDLAVVGWRPGGIGVDGVPGMPGLPTWSFSQSEGDQEGGASDAVSEAYRYWFGTRPGVVMSIWDPARCYGLAHLSGPWELWGYVPLDAPMMGDRLFGPAHTALMRYTRLLAYTRWGSQILKTTTGQSTPYLPHGLHDLWWGIGTESQVEKSVGIVATNQPRKDWGTALQACAELRRRGHKVNVWAHTDRMVGPAWSLPQLVDGCGLAKRISVTLSALDFSDEMLRNAYQSVSVTLHPGLGEGFGYPIVESLASGTPSVHVGFGGGAELIPRSEWRFPQRGQRLEGAHALVRPILDFHDVANAIERVWNWQSQWEDKGRSYCAGAVQHLRWNALWPRWRSWIRQGLESME